MAAEPAAEDDRDERALAAARDLIAERIVGRFAIFWDVGEGTMFPDGTEDMSGHVIDEQGRIYIFWTEWDASRNRPMFGTWKQIEGKLSNETATEYRRAREAVGLI
jgi:hypothetical protein